MKELHAVSLSGGKDSTYMTLEMVKRGMPIDLVLAADTGMEFPEMYEHLSKVDDFLFRERGLHITYLQHTQSFEWMMFEKPVCREPGKPQKGYGWPLAAPGHRWCTGFLKTHLIDKKVNQLKASMLVRHYVGIAADEPKRIKGECYPLVEWGITEAMALQGCYERGFDWGGLYKIYRRCSCWCCPLQRIGELRKLRHYHPELWQRLRKMDARAKMQFGSDPLGQFKERWSVEELDERFANEDMQLSLFGEEVENEISQEAGEAG